MFQQILYGTGVPMKEYDIEQQLIEKLGDLKYTYRPDIRDRASLGLRLP